MSQMNASESTKESSITITIERRKVAKLRFRFARQT